jgi:hypothetical protein
MAILTSISCDQCGRTRGEGNHWFKIAYATAISAPRLYRWDAKLKGPQGHICSASCAHLVLDKWITIAQDRTVG